ncbi:MAG: protease modulator HflC [Lachnospiraceae bacterium]|nr:protease modulator HflC [Lachnospiraceae bacterium]MBO5146343.1 protease modulator HflC [Lachnospiraceae bacterium]
MKKKIGSVLGLIIVAAAVVILANSAFVIKENQYGLVRQFGKIERVISDSGLYFKIPFIQEKDTVTKELLLYDIAKSDVITQDKKSMIVDSFVLWRVTDPKVFAQTLNTSEQNAEGRINVAVYNSIKNVISSMTQSDIIAARGQKLTSLIVENVTGINQYGIEITSVEIKLLDLPEDNKNAVFERMISERENIAATYTAEGNADAQKIKNTTDRETAVMISEAEKSAEILKAEGEAEYMKEIAAAYDGEMKADFYSFTRSLDALKNSVQGGNKTVILDKDSPITQIFYNH